MNPLSRSPLACLTLAAALCTLAAAATATAAAPWTDGMQEGAVNLKSAGPITFGPEGILFVADTKAAAIIAIDTRDTKAPGGKSTPALQVTGIDRKIAALLGTVPDQILIQDLAVNPISRQAYLAVSRGRGPDATALLIRVPTSGNLEVVPLEKVRFSRGVLPDAPVDGVVGQGNRQSNPRQEAITDLAFLEDRVLVAGLSNEEFASTLRAIPFPFKTVAQGTSVEIYHGAHGRFETRAPVRTFIPMKVGNEPQVLAAYTCTPLVQFPLKDLTPGAKVKGKTIAELGNRNRPLDMILYQKDGHDFLLLANSSRGVMKIDASLIEKGESITQPVKEGTKGVPYETIAAWKGIDQLDRYDAGHAAVLRRADADGLTLESLPLP